MQLAWIDYLLILIYFTFVLGIGFVLKRHAQTSTDFFLSGQYSKQLWLLLGLAPALLAIARTRARRQALGSF